MDRKTSRALKRFSKDVKEILEVEKIILFGSFAKGEQKDNSDIDIAVIVSGFDGDYLELNAKLFSIVKNIDVRIEPIILNRKNDRSGFLESIEKYGIAI
ncbi:MAG: nucleotidyltransferase domain-containing protein [Ignavibacteriales bacterium]|nr:nucleotidyltransferase domain-containing protein [Ignavibacteriales bacterium]